MRNSAFTLIELSIVLIIIGLIVGGVLVGRDLIKSSELRAQVTQIEQYNSAVNAFRQKYDCLPGDCATASNFFGSGWLGYWNSYSLPANGNGDDMIRDIYYTSGSPNPFGYIGEPPMLFAHLFLAKLTTCCNPAQFSGFNPSSPAADVIYPASKMAQGGFVAFNVDGVNGWWLGMASNVAAASCGGGNYGEYLLLQASGPCNATRGLFSPAQAKAYDSKIDDGLPETGRVVTVWVWGGDNRINKFVYRNTQTCIASDSTYDLSVKNNACSLFQPIQ